MPSDDKRTIAKIPLQRMLVPHATVEDTPLKPFECPDRAPASSHQAMDVNVEDLETLRALSEKHGVPGIDLRRSRSCSITSMLYRARSPRVTGCSPSSSAATESFWRWSRRETRGSSTNSICNGEEGLSLHRRSENAGGNDRGRVRSQGARRKTLPWPARPGGNPGPARTVSGGFHGTRPARRSRSFPSGNDPPRRHAIRVPGRPRLRASPHPSSQRIPGLPIQSAALSTAAAASAPRTPSAPDPAPPVVVLDDTTEALFQAFDVSTGEFGTLGEELSSVTNLPPELRAGASMAARAIAGRAGKLV